MIRRDAWVVVGSITTFETVVLKPPAERYRAFIGLASCGFCSFTHKTIDHQTETKAAEMARLVLEDHQIKNHEVRHDHHEADQ